MPRATKPSTSIFDNISNWADDAPESLHSAILHVRELFANGHRTCGKTSQVYCYCLLHGGEKSEEIARDYGRNLLHMKIMAGKPAAARFDALVNTTSPPAMFRAWLDLYLACMVVQALGAFQHFAEIGAAQQPLLEMPYLDWAEDQTSHLIRAHRHSVEMWVKKVCDVQPKMSADDDFEEWCHWRKWQAPLFLTMEPARHFPIEADRLSEQMDAEKSQRLLSAIADEYVMHLELHVGRVVGEARLTLAKQPAILPDVHIRQPTETISSNGTTVKGATSSAGPQPEALTKVKSRRKLSRLEERKHSIIFGVLQAKLEGRRYCAALDRKKLPVPASWKADECPGTYAEAYLDLAWRKRIQDEKHRYQKKYDHTPATERERLIQGMPTRRTRQ